MFRNCEKKVIAYLFSPHMYPGLTSQSPVIYNDYVCISAGSCSNMYTSWGFVFWFSRVFLGRVYVLRVFGPFSLHTLKVRKAATALLAGENTQKFGSEFYTKHRAHILLVIIH
jgi:hypothetical protein